MRCSPLFRILNLPFLQILPSLGALSAQVKRDMPASSEIWSYVRIELIEPMVMVRADDVRFDVFDISQSNTKRIREERARPQQYTSRDAPRSECIDRQPTSLPMGRLHKKVSPKITALCGDSGNPASRMEREKPTR